MLPADLIRHKIRFLTGEVAMEQQGPWMANYFYKLDP